MRPECAEIAIFHDSFSCRPPGSRSRPAGACAGRAEGSIARARGRRRERGRDQRQRGEAGPAVDGHAADPGAERVAEIEGGDVEARGEVLPGAAAFSARSICSGATVAKAAAPSSTIRCDGRRSGCAAQAHSAEQHDGERRQRAEQRTRQAAIGELAAERGCRPTRPPPKTSRIGETAASREAGDLGQHRLDIGEDREQAGKAEHRHEQARAAPAAGRAPRAPRASECGRRALRDCPWARRARARRSATTPMAVTAQKVARQPRAGRARRRTARRAGWRPSGR